MRQIIGIILRMRKIAHTAGSDDAFIKAGDLVRVRNRLFRQLCCGDGGEENFGYVNPRGLVSLVLLSNSNLA